MGVLYRGVPGDQEVAELSREVDAGTRADDGRGEIYSGDGAAHRGAGAAAGTAGCELSCGEGGDVCVGERGLRN